MIKAYSVVKDLNEEAIQVIKQNNIDLTCNSTGIIPTTEEIILLLKEYDILIIGIRTLIKKEILNTLFSKKIIATLSVGVDHIDKEVLEHPLVEVMHIKTANALSVAEHIFSFILSLNKRIYGLNTLVLKKKGRRKNLFENPDDISEKTLGLIGAGNITREVIKIAQVFHMPMLCYTKHPEKHTDLLKYGIRFITLEELLKTSDIITVNLPLTKETNRLIAKDQIKLMKKNATFINTSRRDIVDTKALIDYAEENKTFYVGLDIDLDGYEKLFSKYRPNVLVTPHTAGVTKQANKRMDIEIAEKIVDFLHKNEETML